MSRVMVNYYLFSFIFLYFHDFSLSFEVIISFPYFTLFSSCHLLVLLCPFFFSVSPAPKSILSFFRLTLCLLFSPLSSHPLPCSFLSLSPSLVFWKRYHLFSRMSWICSYAITTGTVTKEIMSESNRETDGWSGGGGVGNSSLTWPSLVQ